MTLKDITSTIQKHLSKQPVLESVKTLDWADGMVMAYAPDGVRYLVTVTEIRDGVG